MEPCPPGVEALDGTASVRDPPPARPPRTAAGAGGAPGRASPQRRGTTAPISPRGPAQGAAVPSGRRGAKRCRGARRVNEPDGRAGPGPRPSRRVPLPSGAVGAGVVPFLLLLLVLLLLPRQLRAQP